MKKIILLVFGLPTFLFGQADVASLSNSSSIKISPFQFSRSFFELSYEKRLANSFAWQLSPMLMLRKDEEVQFQGGQVDFQVRKYIINYTRGENKIPLFSDISIYSGLYGLGMSFSSDFIMSYWDPISGHQMSDNYESTIRSLEAGVMMGCQFHLAKKVVFDFLIGGGARLTDYYNSFFEAEIEHYQPSIGVFDLEYTGVKPRVNFQIGIVL